MKVFAITTITAAALGAAALGFAGPAAAAAGPTGPSSVTDTVKNLESHGYEVIMTKLSSGALTPKCSVVAVRDGTEIPPQKVSEIHGTMVPKSVHKTVYLDVRC